MRFLERISVFILATLIHSNVVGSALVLKELSIRDSFGRRTNAAKFSKIYRINSECISESEAISLSNRLIKEEALLIDIARRPYNSRALVFHYKNEPSLAQEFRYVSLATNPEELLQKIQVNLAQDECEILATRRLPYPRVAIGVASSPLLPQQREDSAIPDVVFHARLRTQLQQQKGIQYSKRFDTSFIFLGRLETKMNLVAWQVLLSEMDFEFATIRLLSPDTTTHSADELIENPDKFLGTLNSWTGSFSKRSLAPPQVYSLPTGTGFLLEIKKLRRTERLQVAEVKLDLFGTKSEKALAVQFNRIQESIGNTARSRSESSTQMVSLDIGKNTTVHTLKPRIEAGIRHVEIGTTLSNGSKRTLLTLDKHSFESGRGYSLAPPINLDKGASLWMRYLPEGTDNHKADALRARLSFQATAPIESSRLSNERGN